MPLLTAIQGALAGQSFEVTGPVVIGRSPDCTIMLPDRSVSRQHARIEATPDGVCVEDLLSGNGTVVNGQIITARTVLHDQDVVEICSHVFRFSEGEAGAAAPSPAAKVDLGIPPAAPSAALQDNVAAAGAAIQGTFDMGATMVGGVFTPSVAGDLAKATERLQSIVRISSAIQTELELDVLLSAVLDNLLEVFRAAERGALMLYDEAGKLVPAASRNRRGEAEDVAISRSIVQEAVDRRVAILSMDAMTDERFGSAMSIAALNMRSMMCAPLIARDDVLGIIHVDTTRQNRLFTNEDLELLSGVAAQTALAIASAKMHQRLLKQDRMERDLKVATQVQTSFLPSSTPEVEGMEFSTFYRAALDIGGDLYDFVPQPDGGMIVVLGDVSGKGVPAALLMARMSSDVRFYSVQQREPKDILPFLSARMDETGMSDAFVTMALVRVDPGTHEMLIANAGHCDPLVRRAADGEVVRVGGEPGFPLGIMPDFEYAQSSYALQPGDVVCLVSDGVTEAMDAGKNQYSEERLIRTIAAAPATARGVLDAVLADVKAHVGDTPQSDDLTCVCFGIQP
jgi:sigma-B regulation protein RsbU (phosphoserine phosphatase)